MHRTIPYLALFLATVLLQVFLFDNLSISIYLNPLVYVAFVILLPLETPPVAVLLAGLATGATMDLAMGAAGENTIATLLVAFLRPMLLDFFAGHDNVREGGTPSAGRLGARSFARYAAAMVAVHHTLFFLLESLSWVHLLHTLVRALLSSALTMLFVWLIARIFTAKLPVRI